jgi:uncharacterized protein
MLIQFTVENFLSFRDEAVFSMVAVINDQQHPSHVVKGVAGKDRSLLRTAAIYGANAAGKSNLIKAIQFAEELILEGTRSGRTIPVPTFKLGNYGGQPSKFEFIFTYENILYSYGFKLNASQILEEWLYATPNKQEVLYFERITSAQKGTEVKFGAALVGRGKKKEKFLDFVAQGTRPNQLFITEAVDRNVTELLPIIDWFKKELVIIPAESRSASLEINVHTNTQFTDFLEAFLQTSDTGIEKIATEESVLDLAQVFPEMPEDMRQELVQQISNMDKDEATMLQGQYGKRYLVIKGEQGQSTLLQLKTQHRNEEGRLVDFSMEEESEGTQRLINLIPALFRLKEGREQVVFIDELDRRLHPLLSRLFIEAVLECNGKNSTNQLVFTTHDTNLLDLTLLRRDEIWFVEKNKQGASHLYSLAEFKIRPDLKIEKGYLNGRFGAIPFLGDVCNLGWTADESKTLVEA